MNSFLKPLFVIITIIFCLLNHTQSFDKQKVTSHFKQIDTNSDNMIDLEQYANLLQLQDQLMDINQDEDYYRGLVDLLYEQYDSNGDKKVDMKEWIQFATDIVDESEPIYQEIMEEKREQRKRKIQHKQNWQNEDI